MPLVSSSGLIPEPPLALSWLIRIVTNCITWPRTSIVVIICSTNSIKRADPLPAGAGTAADLEHTTKKIRSQMELHRLATEAQVVLLPSLTEYYPAFVSLELGLV